MASPRLNGVSNGPGGSRSRSRPFTLQEALPFSPQTSVLPFTPDLIPDPRMGSGSLGASLTDLFSSDEFEAVNHNANAQDSPRKHIKQTADALVHEIKLKERTAFKFKAPGTLSRTRGPSFNGGAERKPTDDLSPLSRAVLDRVANSFAYPGQQEATASATPHSRPSPSSASHRSTAPRSETPKLAANKASNRQAFQHNRANIEVAIPLTKPPNSNEYVEIDDTSPPDTIDPRSLSWTPRPQVPKEESVPPADSITVATVNPSDLQIASQIPPAPTAPPPAPAPATPATTLTQPPLPSATPLVPRSGGLTVKLTTPSFNKDEYVEIPDEPEALTHLSSRKRKRDDLLDEEGLVGAGLDQRERAETALKDLQRLSREIFSAVGEALGGDGQHKHMVVVTENNEATLTPAIHQKVQAAIQKVISLGSYDQVPVEDLTRYQALCEAGLKNMEGLELNVDDTWGETEVASWLQQVPEIETALKAARTALRIMSGGRTERKLYSEGTIQQCMDLFRNAMDGIIIPMVELRNAGSSASLFKLLSPHKKAITPIFTNTQRLFALMATLVTSIELSEPVLNALEFTSSRLIFVENAHYEKDSVIGVQKFDGLRLVAMDVLCQIFISSPDQRQGIFNDILTSLEKLPVGKQSARHFKLADGGSIQPVSALIMRLVQASSSKIDDKKGRQRPVLCDSNDEVDDEDKYIPISNGKAMAAIESVESGADRFATAIEELGDAVKPLVEAARGNAHSVISFIVNRALRSTKSGDSPYRNLLDLFVEDFTACLESPDWPAAELLLRIMMGRMIQLTDNERTAAPAKNLALDVLGTMGAAISRLRSHVRKTANNLEVSASDELGQFLSDLAVEALEHRARLELAVGWTGPYRVVLEHLEEKCSGDHHLNNSIAFIICDWASATYTGYKALDGDGEDRDRELGRQAFRLRQMIDDRRWMTNEYTFKSVSASQVALAYSIILLRSPLCGSFHAIFNKVMGAMASDQATVRSKSLKSVNQILETDPAILDGQSTVVQLILQCAEDSSPQVRDSALGLMSKCMTMRPQLERPLTPHVIGRFTDAGLGPRKRSMKLARDIYLRNNDRGLRVAIASGLLLRVQDRDEGVRDLARQLIEEIWFAPFYTMDDTPALQTALADQASLMIQVSKFDATSLIMDKLLQTILGTHGKTAAGPLGVCKKLVATLFELVDAPDSGDASVPSGRDALQVLMTFSKAEPKLFDFEQIRLLRPHLSSFKGEDFHVARATVHIYRRVLPHLSITQTHPDFLPDVLRKLIPAIRAVYSSRTLLDDVIACAWIVAGLVNDFRHVGNVAASSMVAVHKMIGKPLSEKEVVMLSQYALIFGMIGKHCDIDIQSQEFKSRFPAVKGHTVPSLMVDILAPHAAPKRPEMLRKAALDAMGLVCQSWPRNFVRPNVYTTFQQVFDEKNQALEYVILSSFKEFLFSEERRSELASQEANGADADNGGGKKRELTVMGGTNYDDVASATTQRFLGEVTRIATSSLGEHAFLALEVLGSINRQGLVHPKQTGVTLITLQTSPTSAISELAFQEYRALHEKHETVLEREYVRAAQSAFVYQRDVVGDPRGATAQPFQSKLHLLMQTLKISRSKNRQRFLEKLCAQVDFDYLKLDVRPAVPPHVAFSRFIIENLAFFEYVTVGEVLATVAAMEKIVTGTGATIAHIIESEVFDVRMGADLLQQEQKQQEQKQQDQRDELAADGPTTPQRKPAPVKLTIDKKKLRQLTAAAMILLSLWEARTYLRRMYSLGTQRRDPKAKAAAKDLTKAPVRAQNVTGDKFWEEMSVHMSGLDGGGDDDADGSRQQENMLRTCRAFVELLNVDQELKVADDDDENDDEMNGDGSGSEGEGGTAGTPGDRGRKRRGGGGGTPGRPRKRARSGSQAPRPRGRPRKHSVEVTRDDGSDMDWA